MAQRICPNCNSEDIEPEVADFSGFLHGSVNKWTCNDCEYIGLAPEKINSQNSDSSNVNQKKHVERSTLANYAIIILTALLLGLLMTSIL